MLVVLRLPVDMVFGASLWSILNGDSNGLLYVEGILEVNEHLSGCIFFFSVNNLKSTYSVQGTC